MARLEHASQVYSGERIAYFKEQGYWTDKLIVDFLDEHAVDQPQEVGVVDERRRITWGDLKERTDRLAAGLIDLGLARGEFVGIQLPNWIEFVEIYLAVQRAGLRALTLMTIYREHDVRFMLNKCRARALVIPDRYRGYDYVDMARRLLDDVPTLAHVIVVGEAGERMISIDDLPRTPSPAVLARRRPDPDEVSKVSFTSGTTGRPKGVTHTHNTDLVPPRLTAEALGLGRHTPIWMPSPIAHVTGLAFGVYDSLLCGARLVLQDKWDAGRALELIERERPVFTVSATPFISGLLNHPDRPHRDVSSFRYFASGGAPIPPRLVRRAYDELSGMLLLRVFGQTEAPLHVMNFPDDPWEKRLNTDGRPLPGCEVRIVDSTHSREVPRGEVGEYATRGPHVFLGYYDEPELTAEARDSEGWYYSADLCRMDEDGYVTYVDRIKDIINRGGVKISALEVEELVARHPAVQSCAAVAMPDERLGERICVFVVPRPGEEVKLEDVTAMLDELGVTKQKWPERLVVVDELPTTPTGKVRKNVLRERARVGQ